MLKTKDPDALPREPMAARLSVHRTARFRPETGGLGFIMVTDWRMLRHWATIADLAG
jgi:hypothetical protein